MEKIEKDAEAMGRDEPPSCPARVRGVGRSAEDQRTLLVAFDRIPTDDDIRAVHETLREASQ